MAEQPSGTVTFLFTDIEQSTRLLAELGSDTYGEVLGEHAARLREAFDAGYEVDTQGDSLFYAFDRADDAVRAAAAGQRALDGLPLRVRMGIHTGQPAIVRGRYVGLDVHQAARICAAAHGGQVVLSQATRDLAAPETRDLGEHRLKDLTQPQRLYQLLAPGLDTTFAPLRTLVNRPTNLPAQSTPLVGRAAELEALRSFLADDAVRLVTLTGSGGSGKTRLALHAAAEAVELFPGGVWLVSLEAVHDESLLLPMIAQTLGLFDAGDRPVEAVIREYLERRRVLLVLDNFEQLLDAGRTISDLLDDSPELKLVVTSRARLRVAAEHAFPVPPLQLPDPRSLPALEALSQYEAVALFIERARAVVPAFTVTDENAPAIAELCVRLDGLPLAIELAATRVKLLPPQALLARLGQRLDLLRGGARDRPERQQTLRATIDWSFDLLDATGQRLFSRLSVFAGGFRLEAAEGVCDADLDELEALLDNSLLRSEERPDGEPRFSMLETIRGYAREQLERDGAAEDLLERHARWFADWLDRRSTELLEGASAGAWEPADDEQENIRATLAWARNRGDVELELQFAGSAGLLYWPDGGRLTEARRWLDDLLARSNAADRHRRGRALVAAAQIARRQGDYDGCESRATEAQAVLEQHDDRPFLAVALLGRGIAAETRGDFASEADFYDAAERLYREMGNDAALNGILNNRAYADIVNGDYESAERRLDEVATSATGDEAWIAAANHGLVLARLGRLDDAEARFAAIVRHGAAHRSAELALYGFEGLAVVAASRADDFRAAQLRGVSAGIREETGYVLAPAEQQFHDELVPEVLRRLGEDDFGRALHTGRHLSFEQATAVALREIL